MKKEQEGAKMIPYDENNVFAKILRGEIPCNVIDENDEALAFADVNPQAPNHVLIIPKGAYVSFADFSERATSTEIVKLVKLIGKVARELGLQESGYRLLANHGEDAHQEVPHFHVHLCGGRPLGALLSARTP